MAGFRAEPPGPLPRRPGGRLCAPRWDSVSGAGLRRTKPQGADLGEIRRRARGWGDAAPLPPPRDGGSRWGGVQATAVPGSSQLWIPAVCQALCSALFHTCLLYDPTTPSVGVMGGVPQSEPEGRARHRCPPDLGKASLLRVWGCCYCKWGYGGGGVSGKCIL